MQDLHAVIMFTGVNFIVDVKSGCVTSFAFSRNVLTERSLGLPRILCF